MYFLIFLTTLFRIEKSECSLNTHFLIEKIKYL